MWTRNMKVFIAGIATETNTFLPFPTGEAGFAASLARGRRSTRLPAHMTTAPLVEWRRLAEAEGHEVVESLCAAAQPSGITVGAVYERMRDEILADLAAALPVDVVLLNLHGAMVADGYDDCEGDVLTRVRELVGPNVPVGAELDLHCHTTRAMFDGATCLIAYKEYPHTDIVPRAAELYRICVAAAEGRVRPATGVFDCRMVNMWRTPVEPMRSFVHKMQALEGHDGVLSVSFGHGFPWGDVPDLGAKVWVVTDGDRAKAERLAAELGREIWDMREATPIRALSVDAALDRAQAASHGPVVIADMADNPGGGAPGDNTAILARLIARGIGEAALGYLWDPLAVEICRAAGVGARLELRVGGKAGRISGDPLDLEATVTAISADLRQTGLTGGEAALGAAAAIRVEPGIDVVLVSDRCQVFAPDGFTRMGVDPARRRLVVVKSMNHFYAAFAPLAAEILNALAPSAMPCDFATIPYRKFDRPYWPRLANPFA
jgi:microcystin degradation protein MlrC